MKRVRWYKVKHVFNITGGSIESGAGPKRHKTGPGGCCTAGHRGEVNIEKGQYHPTTIQTSRASTGSHV